MTFTISFGEIWKILDLVDEEENVPKHTYSGCIFMQQEKS